MGGTMSSRGARTCAAMLGLLAVLVAHTAAAAVANPDFDGVVWTPLGCDAPDLISHASPAAVDFAGDATFPAAYFAHDDGYLYFRYRVDREHDPARAELPRRRRLEVRERHGLLPGLCVPGPGDDRERAHRNRRRPRPIGLLRRHLGGPQQLQQEPSQLPLPPRDGP